MDTQNRQFRYINNKLMNRDKEIVAEWLNNLADYIQKNDFALYQNAVDFANEKKDKE